MRSGISRISGERARQIGVEGWSHEHDDEHANGEMALAAVCYAAPVEVFRIGESVVRHPPIEARGVVVVEGEPERMSVFYDPWPWDAVWDKRKKHDRIRQLTIAGALIAAEIDRLQRAADEPSI